MEEGEGEGCRIYMELVDDIDEVQCFEMQPRHMA